MSGGMCCGVPSKPSKGTRIVIAISASLMVLALCAILAWKRFNNEYGYHYQVGQEVQVKHTNCTGVIVARVGGTYHLRLNQTLAVVQGIQEFELEAK